MRQAGERPAGLRVRGLIVVLWRAGLRVSEALALAEGDLEPGRGAILVRQGKGGRRREVGMDDWGWRQLEPWLKCRLQMPVGALFCVINGPTAGGLGRRPRREHTSDALPGRQAFAVASPHTSYVTPMQLRWQGKVSP
jgi:site-specific recombinase XerD